MAIDATKIGNVVAAQMEALEERFGDDCEIGDVCTIVEIVGPHGSEVAMRSSDIRAHALIGLLRMAERMTLQDVRSGPAGEPGEEI